MTRKSTLTAIALGAFLGIIGAIATLTTAARAAENPLGCFVGGSAGASISASRISGGDTAIDLGTSSPMVSAEAGCKLAMQGFSLGGMLRYDYLNARTKIDAESIKNNGRWMALATIGAPLNDTTSIYALGGISGTKFDFADVATKTTTNWVVGGGISTAFLKTGVSLFAEYNAILPKDVTYQSVTFRNADHLVRIGARIGF